MQGVDNYVVLPWLLNIHIYMQKHIQHNKDERRHFFRKIYLSLYWKGCVWEGVGDRTKTATYRPPNSSCYHSLSFTFSWGCSTGGLGAQLFTGSWFPFQHLSPTDLNFLSPGLYNNLTSTYFLQASQFRTQFNPSTVKVAPNLLISSTGCTYYLHRCISSFDSLAGSEVNMQRLLLLLFQTQY